MAAPKRDQTGERLKPAPSRRLVFHSGVVSLDDPRITALPETYDGLTARLGENFPAPIRWPK